MIDIKITEGEVQSLVRRFLIANNFRVCTRTANQEIFHYQIRIVNPPMFKNPDLVAIKNGFVLVIEVKILFSKLFSGNISDIQKVESFLENKEALTDFKKQLTTIDKTLTEAKVIGCFASIFDKTGEKIPERFVSLEVTKFGESYTVNIDQDAGCKGLFEKVSCTFNL